MPSIIKISNSVNNVNTPVSSFTNTYSILLDGVDECVDISSTETSLHSTTVGTWSVWVKPVDNTPTSTEMIVAFGDTDANSFLQFFVKGTTGVLSGQLMNSGTTQWSLDVDVNPFTSGVWTHIALVADGVSIPIIYVNGVKPAQTDGITTDVTQWFNSVAGFDNGFIGCRSKNSSIGFYYNGNIDEALFINRALTQPQIADIYNSGTPKDESGIANGVSYLRMGDGTGDNWNVDNVNEWTFIDQINSNNGVTVNCEEADVETDTP